MLPLQNVPQMSVPPELLNHQISRIPIASSWSEIARWTSAGKGDAVLPSPFRLDKSPTDEKSNPAFMQAV